MAKVQLTPEEIAAKKIRRSNGWTRFWAIVVALVLVFGASGFAANKAQSARKEAEDALAEQQEAAQQAAANSAVVGGVSGGSGTATGGDTAAVTDEAQAAVDAINAATAAAVDGGAGYTWTRTSEFTQNVDVGGYTSLLNGIIQVVDPNASVDSVVAGFLGIGSNTVDIAKGADAQEAIGYHGAYYILKGTSLQASDLQNLQVNGDTYTFTLPDADTPQRDGGTALNRLTEDIVVQDEVSAEIQAQVSDQITVTSLVGTYSNINVTVVITDGQLQELSYSYDATVTELGLRAAFVNITGTGAMHTEASYTNFVY